MKKLINLYLPVFILLLLNSCENCDEVVLNPCGETLTNTVNCGMTVITCHAQQNQPIGAIYDTRMNSNAQTGDDWANPSSGTPVPVIHPTNWTEDKIGQIFGIATDNADNIYLASTDVYFLHPTISPISSSNTPSRPYPPGQIFKCSPPSWNAVPLVSLPSSLVPYNGIGNIAFDKWNNQLFATNLEDGKIYRIDVNSFTILDSYDPWDPDDNSTGLSRASERIWGINLNLENGKVKVYFPRITNTQRLIYSITLNNGNFPSANSEVIEIDSLPGTQTEITDIAFSSNNQEMLIAERGKPHNALVISYSLSGNTWIFNKKYFIGGNTGTIGENAAGGIDFAYTQDGNDFSEACDEYFWASGNYMMADAISGEIYGIQGVAYSGNTQSSTTPGLGNNSTDLFIDLDGMYSFTVKGTIGDVEVIDCIDCIDPCELNDYIN